jgi:hypothetical protein
VAVSEAPSRATQHAAGDSPPRRADGDREPRLRLHAHPRGAEESGASRGTVNLATILKEQGIPPSGERQTSWHTFLHAYWSTLVAADFFTTEVWTVCGLGTYYTLFVVELHLRRVWLVGSTPNPNEAFMRQMVRALTDASDGVLGDRRFLICDRDRKMEPRCSGSSEDGGGTHHPRE